MEKSKGRRINIGRQGKTGSLSPSTQDSVNISVLETFCGGSRVGLNLTEDDINIFLLKVTSGAGRIILNGVPSVEKLSLTDRSRLDTMPLVKNMTRPKVLPSMIPVPVS